MKHVRGEEDFTFTASTEEAEKRRSEIWEKYQGFVAEMESLRRKIWLLEDEPARKAERDEAEARFNKLKRESLALEEELDSLN